MRKSAWIGGLVGGAVVLAVVFLGMRDDADERAITEVLHSMTASVERGDRETFWSHLAPDYRPVGRYISQYSAEMIVDRVFQVPARLQNPRIILGGLKIRVGDDQRSASAQFKVQIEGEGMLWSVSQEQMDRNRVQLKMRRYGADGRVLESSLAWSMLPF